MARCWRELTLARRTTSDHDDELAAGLIFAGLLAVVQNTLVDHAT